jgi:ligand-binding sensor domain-containing protein/signal transduction histidine kinase
MVGAVLVCVAPPAKAIDPARMLSQYMREQWGSEKGFTGGAVTAIAQTTDGYLWIGTEKGLVRFDGLNFRLYQQAVPTSLAIGAVQALAADAQGNLWVVLQSTKILRYHDGKFEGGREEAEFGITSVSKRDDGTILFSSLSLGTLAYHSGKFEMLTTQTPETSGAGSGNSDAQDTQSSRFSWATGVVPHRYAEPNSAVSSMAETRDGRVWLGTRDRGLFYLEDGQIAAVPNDLGVKKINCLLAVDNELWVGTDEGLFRWDGTKINSLKVPSSLRHTRVLSMIRDRDANLWVGASSGLIRVNDEGVSVDTGNSFGNGAVSALFEDREGNLWVGGSRGIERLRDSAFVTYTLADQESASNGPIYVDEEQRVWFAPYEGGLHWLKGEKSGKVTQEQLDRDVVYSIAGNGKDLWIGRQQGGLTHLQYTGETLQTKTYTEANGLAQNSVYAVYESRDGTVWAGTLSGGVSEIKNGRFTNYTFANGLTSNTVASITETPDGTMWFATPKGVNALKEGHWKVFGASEGLPSENINCLQSDSMGVLWIGTASGLAYLKDGHVQVASGTLAALQEQIMGVAEDRKGWLWISTSNHVLRVKRDKLLSNSLTETDVREYGLEDGLHGLEGIKRQQSVFADGQGKVWFSMNRGLSEVDPARAINNSAPALVQISGVSADGSTISLQEPVRLAGVRRRITLSYAALSLAVPERVRYRYQLDGFDRDWSEPVTTREAVYTNLGPGIYHFHVVACNSEGMWNKEAATLEFRILPAYYQTSWFLLVCFLIAGFLGLAVYRWRVRQMADRLDLQFKERLSERTRIAGELHDTLLQSFQGLTLNFQKARNLLPERPAEAIKTLDKALDGAEQAIVEGREAILGIRSPAPASKELSEEVASLCKEIKEGYGDGHPAEYRVVVEGAVHDLHPSLQVEIFRVAREALRNAFGHSHAKLIETEITYSKKLFRLRVRDDGKGLDPEVRQKGERAGHWGLRGMRERAKRIGGELELWSEPGAGTEVELKIPGPVAYRTASVQDNNKPNQKKAKQTNEHKS